MSTTINYVVGYFTPTIRGYVDSLYITFLVPSINEDVVYDQLCCWLSYINDMRICSFTINNISCYSKTKLPFVMCYFLLLYHSLTIITINNNKLCCNNLIFYCRNNLLSLIYRQSLRTQKGRKDIT